MRTSLFMALLLLSPLMFALPITSSFTPAATTIYTSSAEETLTYTSAATQTYYASTAGLALVQAPIDLPAQVVGFMAPKGKCSQYTYPLTVTSGTIVNLEMTSTYPANFYLLPTYAYQSSSDGCEVTNPSSILFQANFTSYTLRWTAPEDGTFYIILTGPMTVIMLEDAGSSHPVKELANITYPTSTQTSFQDYSSTTLSTATYTATSNQPLLLQLQGWPGFEILALLGLIACLGIAAIVLTRRRSA